VESVVSRVLVSAVEVARLGSGAASSGTGHHGTAGGRAELANRVGRAREAEDRSAARIKLESGPGNAVPGLVEPFGAVGGGRRAPGVGRARSVRKRDKNYVNYNVSKTHISLRKKKIYQNNNV
jgi:hypothetical protein